MTGSILMLKTMSELIGTNLNDGDVVRTIGYYNIFDEGGAVYLISNASTDYAIPLNNGKFALLRDTFDIRKFGIRSGATLDQTVEMDRMIAYADTREYEIDFHNFDLMTPTTTRWTNSAGSVIKGLMFRKPHRLKNIRISNDKTNQLKQGTNCILFAPDDLNGEGLFELDNVVFDPYVADYLITSQNMDGFMCGFVCEFHPDSGAVYPITDATKSKYQLSLKNISFKSPAVSYNISCSNVFLDKIFVDNMFGEYLGAYLVAHTFDLESNNFSGVFRDDYYAASGRSLVTNLIQHEPEVGGLSIELGNYVIDGSSCMKYTNGEQHCVFKAERKSDFQIFNSIQVTDTLGSIEAYAGSISDESIKRKFQINTMSIANPRGILSVRLPVYIKELTLNSGVFKTDFNITAGLIDNIVADTVNVVGKMHFPRYLAFADTKIIYLYLSDIVVNDLDYGLVNNPTVIIDNIVIDSALVNSSKLIGCKFKSIKVSGLSINTTVHNNFIYSMHTSGAFTPSVTIVNYHQEQYLLGSLVKFESTLAGTLKFSASGLAQTDNTENCTVSYTDSRVKSSKTYDPPSIAANGSVSTTVTLNGCALGDIVQASFSQYNAGIEISAVVSATNTVTVKLRNTSGSAVNLAIGTLTVKLV
ncbi:hypothetical protein [Cohnella soli]|uniref:Uncharacterized protein n=1 Tax=Cohnella soli TaxID=425005 RepID=A0ABW0HXW9_9BACL